MTSEFFDEDEGVTRPRPLGNMAVIGFMWRHWMVDKPRFFTAAALFLVGTACDLSIPWAAGALVDAVSSPDRLTQAAWTAWAFLTGLYVVYFGVRIFGSFLSKRAQAHPQLGGIDRIVGVFVGAGRALVLLGAVLVWAANQAADFGPTVQLAGYVALGGGWALVIAAIFLRTRYHRRRLAELDGAAR